MILRFFIILLLMPIYAIVIVFIYTELSELFFSGEEPPDVFKFMLTPLAIIPVVVLGLRFIFTEPRKNTWYKKCK